ncbi:hypothetical protein [Limimaricola hongkongensis]|nr:hypothetical protein [Limimaricola hongkongensis]
MSFITNRLTLAVATGALSAGAAMATPYDGTYRPSADSDCSRVGVEGGALRIEDGLFEGIASECRMTRPVDVVDMDATLYTMECSAGETRWTERALLMQAAGDDGLIMLWNGYAFRYARCSAEAIAGETPPANQSDAAAPDDEPAPVAGPPPRVLLPRILLPGDAGPAVEIGDDPAPMPEEEPPGADAPKERPEDDTPEDAPDASAGTSARASGAGGAG